ncbi:hypothetical protein JCM3770_001380 [Rhodotorula araucariae]
MAAAARSSPRPIRSAGVRRLLQEAHELELDDCAEYAAQPLEDDIFQWHFTLRGAKGSDYDDGVYHGKLVLPSDYPFKPPEVYMLTPSGRFEVNKRICLSISSFHPETWQPSWGIRTALLAIMAFFETEPKGAVGSLDAPPAERRRLAVASRTYKCATCGFDAADGESFAALRTPKSVNPEPAADGADELADAAVTAVKIAVVPAEAVRTEATTPASSEAPSPSPSPAPPDSGDELEGDTDSAAYAPRASSASPTTLFPSAPSPSQPTPRTPRSSSSGRTPRAPQAPVDPFSAPGHRSAHAHAHAGPLVAPGAPRLAPAHLPARATPPNPPLAHTTALPPGVALAQLAPDGSAGGGPPSWVDRAVVACVLALIALVVRKVA